MSALFRKRNFALLWIAQVISGVGDVLYTVGVMVTIFEQTGSALQTVGVTIATMLPPFLLGPFAGALVDKHSRRNVLLAMDLIRAVLVAGLWLLVRSVGFDVAGIYAIVAGLAAATAFYKPARQAILPSIVKRRELVAANSLILSTTQGTFAAGFLLGGLLILWLSFEMFVVLNLVSFLIAAGLTLFIQVQRRTDRPEITAKPATPLFQSIRDGVAYLRTHALARPLVVMEILEFVPHGIWTSALMLVFVKEALGGTTADWGYQNTAYFSGQIVGAIIVGMIASRLMRRPGRIIISNAFLNAALTFIYAASPTNLFATTIAFVFGPPMAMRDIAQDSLLQTVVSEDMLGRVYAMRSMFTSVAFMVAGVMFAWLADQIPVRWIYVMGAILYAGTAVYAASSRAMRQSQMEPETGREEPVPVAANV